MYEAGYNKLIVFQKSKELDYLNEKDYKRFEDLRVEVAKLLFAYRKSLRSKINP